MGSYKRTQEMVDGHAKKKSKSSRPAAVAPEVPASQVNMVEAGGKSCTHEVAWPPHTAEDFSTLPPTRSQLPPARSYSFNLDPFQQTAVNCLEAGQSVLVAAHTSAGKTAVAEYAFAMALRDKQRVVYTSPLKALSNQKYREFYEEFRDVGLLTGDVTINATASCLVMTTEILRSMLLRGSEEVCEAKWIIFDEVHYLRDKERGVVWEESIVLTPKSGRFVFLSATIPNAREFAQWVALIHESPCHVVYTDFRPTPLQHYIFPAGADGLHMVVDEKTVFREDSFSKAVAAVKDGSSSKPADAVQQKQGGKKGRIEREQETDIFKLVRMIMERNYDPVIVFSFSKKECEALSNHMSTLELNTREEQESVEAVFKGAVDCLSKADRELPSLAHILPVLKRGIGIHHSGLLPIVKEVVELLFQEGLIKALFATETFSTGLNMPAKTVVFTHVRKFDGGSFRWITPGEYIQMSGRAGRRGKDDRGIVILMLDAKMEPAMARHMLQGQADPLHSEFHLSYAMLLGLARSSADVTAESLLGRSFRQFQAQRAIPSLQQRIAALQAEADAVEIEDEQQVLKLQLLLKAMAELQAQMRVHMTSPAHALPFLQLGRLVRVMNHPDPQPGVPASTAAEPLPQAHPSPHDAGPGNDAQPGSILALSEDEQAPWGAVVNFQRQGSQAVGPTGSSSSSSKKGAVYVVEVLINCAEGTTPGRGPRRRPQFVPAGQAGVPLVTTVLLPEISAFSSLRIYLPKDLRTGAQRDSALQAVAEVQKRYKGVLPLLDPVDDMRIESSSFRKLQSKLESKAEDRESHPLSRAADVQQRLQRLGAKERLLAQAQALEREVAAAQGIVLHTKLKARRRVLRRLGYVDSEGVVTLKGQVAAEIQSADELVLCELLFKGALQELDKRTLAAVLSCFLWSERTDGTAGIDQHLLQNRDAIVRMARNLADVYADAGLPTDKEQYAEGFRPELMQALHAWSDGKEFKIVLKIASEFFEGAVVRIVRRVEELLQQLREGARVIGDTTMSERFSECSDSIKRDIIFAASLYL